MGTYIPHIVVHFTCMHARNFITEAPSKLYGVPLRLITVVCVIYICYMLKISGILDVCEILNFCIGRYFCTFIGVNRHVGIYFSGECSVIYEVCQESLLHL